jgi:hypothetical protein
MRLYKTFPPLLSKNIFVAIKRYSVFAHALTAHTLTGIRLGRKIRYRLTDVLEFLDKKAEKTKGMNLK